MKQIKILLIGAGLLLATTSWAQGGRHADGGHRGGPEREKVTRADYAAAARFSQKRISNMVYSTRLSPHWFSGSDRFWYSWKTSEGTRYYIVDAAKGTKEEIWDNVKLARELTEIVRDPFDAQHIPLKSLKLKDDKEFTFEIKSSLDSTFRFTYDIASKKLTYEVGEENEKYPHWAAVSPDGTMGVYLKDHNLYMMDSTSLRLAAKDPKDSLIVERRLTTDGTHHFSWNGDDYNGDNETDSTARKHASINWAPDSRHFAIIRYDMSDVKEFWVINSLSKPRPTLETYHYQMPGEKGPKGYLYVFDAQSGESHFIASQAFKDQNAEIISAPPTAEERNREYFSTRWLGDEKGFWYVRMSRDLHRLDLCHVDIAADSTETVISERMNTYVESREPKFTPSGDILWWSERGGWANIYLYGRDGTLKKNLTEGAFHVEDVLGVGPGYMVVSACGVNPKENPYQMHTFRVPLGGGAMTQIDMDDMDVLATVSDNARYAVANYSRVDAKPAVALINTSTGKLTPLEEADFTRLFEAGYKFPERFKVKAADGITDLYGAIYKPFDFDSTKVYPVCDYVYPGPQVEAVNISWSSGMTRTDRLAQLGFIVVTVGNRGGHPNRSKWYHNYGYGNLRDYGLEDQKYAIQQLCERHSYMDVERVGIHGHSGGGFMSTAAILTYPDFFKAAVSCAGNHDNSIYNRWWSEQHHGIKEKVVGEDTTFVYKIDTNQEIAKNLRGHLLLVTGDIDNNVNPANTIRVVNALIRSGKRFDMLVLPGQRHGFGDMNEFFFWKMADHYTRYLMGDKRKRPVDIPEIHND